MDFNRWQKIDTVINQALLIQDKQQRRKYVKDSCENDQQLYDEVKTLLSSINKAEEEQFLE